MSALASPVDATLGDIAAYVLDRNGSEEGKSALLFVIKVLKRIQSNPVEEKYRSLNKSAKSLTRFLKIDGASALLNILGFTFSEDDERIMYGDGHEIALQIAVCESLLPLRAAVLPSTHASLRKETGMGEKNRMNNSTDRDAYLRKIKLEREKKKEQRRRIRKQILVDMEAKRDRSSASSKASPLKFGTKVTQFGDIGIDTWKGGGGG